MNALQKVEPIQQQLQTSPKGVLSGKELNEVVETCKMLATAPYYQKMGPGGILAIWLTAREMGLPPMMCLNGGLYTFSGQVSLSGKVINMLIIQSGHRADVLHLDEKSCKIRFVRGDRKKGEGDTYEYEYTMEMAKNAGLTSKKNWQTNPRDMLYNRCISGGAIKFMPDVTCGAYAIGELPGDGNILDESSKDINVKPLDISTEERALSTEQAIELADLLNLCAPDVKEKILNEWIPKTYKVDLLDDVPASRYDHLKKQFTLKAGEHQKMLAEKEMTINVEVKE
jgi:hypothetical protein